MLRISPPQAVSGHPLDEDSNPNLQVFRLPVRSPESTATLFTQGPRWQHCTHFQKSHPAQARPRLWFILSAGRALLRRSIFWRLLLPGFIQSDSDPGVRWSTIALLLSAPPHSETTTPCKLALCSYWTRRMVVSESGCGRRERKGNIERRRPR